MSSQTSTLSTFVFTLSALLLERTWSFTGSGSSITTAFISRGNKNALLANSDCFPWNRCHLRKSRVQYQRRTSSESSSSSQSQSQLGAIIFGGIYDDFADDNDEEYCSIDDCDEDGHALFGANYYDHHEEMARRLFTDSNRIGSLARLAVAFSPPDRKLDIRDVESVEVLRVDESHIEIEAVVCEDDGCVTLLVPVSFPKPCQWNDEEGEEECVLENIVMLDEQAEATLREWEVRSTAEREELELEEVCSLYARDDIAINLPSWWVPPECKPGLAEECDTVCKLLNEDTFQKEVNALASRGLEQILGNSDGEYGTSEFEVQKAVVTAVGPAGFYLRARTKKYSLFEEEKLNIVDVPLAFGGDPAMDAETLRAAVLGAVAAVHAE